MVKGIVLQYLMEGLSKSDINIVKLLGEDLRPADIAEITGFSPRTIEQKILTLRVSFDCKSVHGLVALFMRNKLIK